MVWYIAVALLILDIVTWRLARQLLADKLLLIQEKADMTETMDTLNEDCAKALKRADDMAARNIRLTRENNQVKKKYEDMMALLDTIDKYLRSKMFEDFARFRLKGYCLRDLLERCQADKELLTQIENGEWI